VSSFFVRHILLVYTWFNKNNQLDEFMRHRGQACMRVYHILPAEHAISNLAFRRIKIARINDLNDPFELLGFDLANPDHHRGLMASKLSLHTTKGLLCFSKSWSNPVLWSHYGDKHRGICLGFDVPDNVGADVHYVTERPPIKELNLQMGLNWLFTKFRHWEYEEEWRAFVTLDESTAENGLFFYEFDEKIVLREVILGALCSIPVERIWRLSRTIDPMISVQEAKLHEVHFSIVPAIRSVAVEGAT
jgi:hypothetical protein